MYFSDTEPDGGCLIRGDSGELRELIETIEEAIEHGEGRGSFISEDGLTELRIERERYEGP